MKRSGIRAIVADDHTLFRNGLIRMLNSFPGIRVVAEAATAAEVLHAITHVEADVLILDLSMPDVTDMDLIKGACAAMPELPILVLSMYDESALVRQAVRAGAAGYVTKNAEPEILATAVARLAEGKRYLAPDIAESMVFAADDGGEAQEATLSARELEVLRLLARDGLSLVDIAERLELSPKTVTSHKANIMAKLGVANNAELIRYVVGRRLFG